MHVLQLFLAHIICVKKSKYVRVQNIFHTQVDCFPSNFQSNTYTVKKKVQKLLSGRELFDTHDHKITIKVCFQDTSRVICWLIDLNN